MNLLKKAAISLAATSMILAPVAASAAPAASFSDVRSVSDVDSESDLLGGTGWIIGLLALAAIIGGILIAGGNNDDTPTSP